MPAIRSIYWAGGLVQAGINTPADPDRVRQDARRRFEAAVGIGSKTTDAVTRRLDDGCFRLTAAPYRGRVVDINPFDVAGKELVWEDASGWLDGFGVERSGPVDVIDSDMGFANELL